ncbi:MAG: nitrile hydratase subunit beta [Candidatus Rokubacteria bacterium 13_1_20CM_4_68_9]|nr:MAG: nitrile hydratase subunit beta [Candidatus Rokubacteria bacterium 13_1_20CM_4_68_9]
MNGVHDMGGMHGLGPVEPEPNEPVFHHDWERKVFALNLATGFIGKWNIDMGRYARELMPGPEYLTTSYYEHWLYGLELLLVEKGLITAEEMRTRRPAGPAPDGLRVLRPDDVPRRLRASRAARMDDEIPAQFKAGDEVVARNIHPMGHTRLPRYARGKRGVVDRDHGVFIYPDAHAAGLGKQPQHCYSVRFNARELWGDEASPRDAIYIDLFEPYLEPA